MNIGIFPISTLVCLMQFFSSCTILSAQECKPGSKPRHYKDDYVLLSSAYKKTTTEHFEACYIDCLAEEKCSSINYHLANRTCEFINVTKACFPSRFIRHEKSIYAEARKQDGCRDLLFLDCVKNKTLIGHVISNMNLQAPALKECQRHCFLEGKCVSYNLGPVRGQNRSCELSAADHSTRREFLVFKEGYEYCLISNPCQSSPCPAGRLCTPDLSWDTFNCEDGAWTQWGPWNATSCSALDLPSTCPRARNRSCTSPAPRNNGANCTGTDVDKTECPALQINTTGCEEPLGMEDGKIAKIQITASSYLQPDKPLFAPWNARLNKKRDATTIGGWASGPKKIGDYIQIDLGRAMVISKVATQGRSQPDSGYIHYVTKYSLSYSNNTITWSDYEGDCIKVFPGNSEKTNTVVAHKLEVPIRARYVRLIVKGFVGHPVVRMELYGCSELTSSR